MTDTVSGLGPAADPSQGKLSASHHYKWQSAASRRGSFSMRGPSSGACRCLCRSRGSFDFLIPARARWIQALHEKYHAQSVIYALVVRGSHVLSNSGKKKAKKQTKKTTTTFIMHTLWSATGITATQRREGGGGWVNKCLEFIQGLHCDSYYTNIHACFSPPSLVVLYAGHYQTLLNVTVFVFVVDDVGEISTQRCKLEPRRKHNDVRLKLHTFCTWSARAAPHSCCLYWPFTTLLTVWLIPIRM